GIEGVETLDGQRADDLAHPVGAKVEAEDPVARTDARRPRDQPGLHELVGLPGVVRPADRGDGVGRGLTHAVHHRVVGDLRTLPALVPVHRVVAAPDVRAHRRARTATAPPPAPPPPPPPPYCPSRSTTSCMKASPDCGGVSRPSSHAWIA